MKDYTEYMNSISADEHLHDKIMERVTHKSKTAGPNRLILRYTGLAACLVIVLISVFTIPGLFNNPATNVPNVPNNIDTSIIGLPVDNFSLGDLHNSTDIMADRIVYKNLSDFLPDMFVFVRVFGTEQWKDEKAEYGDGQRQTSSLSVLSVLWSRDGNVPETLSVTQTLYGGCFFAEETNLLREGGVYLLPLWYSQENDTWYVIGALDVLFEVDDKGRIWSHSSFEGFNRFDGMDASVVADAIIDFTSDENFQAAITSFGSIAWHWGVLAEVTVLSSKKTKDEWGYDRIEYILKADSVLSLSPSPLYSWHPNDGDEMRTVSYGTSEYLEQGGKYLIFLDPSEDGPYIEPGRVTKVNGDGTIADIPPVDEYMPYTNIFTEFNGYTVEQMKNEAERSKAWHESYAN